MSHLITVNGITIKKDDGTEDTIMIPYNTNNVLIQEKDIISILEQYQVKIDKINHINYFQQAMTHKSYLKKPFFTRDILNKAKKELGNPKNLVELRDESYELLEYLGDRVIKLIVSTYLFHRYRDQDEGFMSKLQSYIEDKSNLSKMCQDMKLSKFFIISKHIEMIKGRQAERFNEDIFEAFFGALFLSNGLNPCAELMLNLLETQIDYAEKLYRNKNYKDQLNKFYIANKWGFPEYYDIGKIGNGFRKQFVLGVKNKDYQGIQPTENNKIEIGIGFGVDNKKKDAEQRAAKMALILLGCLKADQYTPEDIYYPNLEEIKNFMITEENNKKNKESNDKILDETNKLLKNLIVNDDNLEL